MDLEALLMEIRKADSGRLDILFEEVYQRKRALYPQWDIICVALPKYDWEEREQTIAFMLKLEKEYREHYGVDKPDSVI